MGEMRRHFHRGLMFNAAAISLAIVAPAAAQTRAFDLPAQDARTGIPAFAKQAGIQLLANAKDLRGKRTNTVHGDFDAQEALKALLKGTGLEAASNAASGIFMVRPSSGEALAGRAAASDESAGSEDVVVTGTRVKGAPPTSPVIRVTQKQIKEAGFTDLGQVVRSIPQNFGGGQNPTVSFGAGGSIANQNITAASSVNLRGLGPDATLTLMNGHRLSYDSFTQAVDISAIPVDAVESVEIVADGASAIYGSDAVGGVVNVKLKSDYQGFATSARLGTATAGGDFQQQYSAVVGTKWSDGGVIATYDFERDTAIYADQRSYTRSMLDPNDLIQPQKHHSGLISGHQDIGDIATLAIDGLFTKRWSSSLAQTSDTFYVSQVASMEYAISPTFTFHLPAGWTAELNGVYSVDNAHTPQQIYDVPGGTFFGAYGGCYCNKAYSGEAGAEGALFSLPGGAARLAFGAGYRKNEFYSSFTTSTSYSRQSGDRSSHYGYAELFMPFVSSQQGIPLIDQLSFNAALRYEKYDDLGAVTTPKLGIIYAPTPWLDVKGSWGRSFKAPTLLQEYSTGVAYLWTTASLGGSALPSNATALVAYGGNRDLAPERATTWSGTFVFHPERLSGFRLETSYFNVNYRNRVVQAVNNLSQALSNPVFQQFLTANPSVAEQNAVIALAPHGIINYSGGVYNPSSVAFIIDDRYVNVSRQKVHGIDLAGTYKWSTLGGTAILTGDASWLKSDQQFDSAASPFALAGTIFNPPHFRGRAGGTFEGRQITLSSFLNYLGPVKDERTTAVISGRAMATVDLAASYRLPVKAGLLKKTEISFSIQNVGGAKPPRISVTDNYTATFDSTNYSSIGRLISLSIAKDW